MLSNLSGLVWTGHLVLLSNGLNVLLGNKTDFNSASLCKLVLMVIHI